MTDNVGKKFEKKIEQWLDRSDEGYCLDRQKDQMSGLYGSKNICDFTLFISPNFYYIECKATYSDRFDFSMVSEYQAENLLKKSRIPNVYGLVFVLFVTQKRAFILNIQDIDKLSESGIKSLNIKKIDKWGIPYQELTAVPSKKELLDYKGDFNYEVGYRKEADKTA